MSFPVAHAQIRIPVNEGAAVLDRAGLADKLIQFKECHWPFSKQAGRVVKVARNYGVTQLLLESSDEQRKWWNLEAMLDIEIV